MSAAPSSPSAMHTVALVRHTSTSRHVHTSTLVSARRKVAEALLETQGQHQELDFSHVPFVSLYRCLLDPGPAVGLPFFEILPLSSSSKGHQVPGLSPLLSWQEGSQQTIREV